MSGLGIFDLAAVAAREAACAAAVAEICGQWIADENPSTRRALWADVAQSHGWYQQLWQERFPVVPACDLPTAMSERAVTEAVSALVESLRDAQPLEAGTDDTRLRVLTTLVLPATLHRLDALAPLVDRDLDLPTSVIIDRVQMDLNRLLYRASQV